MKCKLYFYITRYSKYHRNTVAYGARVELTCKLLFRLTINKAKEIPEYLKAISLVIDLLQISSVFIIALNQLR